MKFYERNLCGIFKTQKDRKETPEIPASRKKERGSFEYLSSEKVVCSKWLDRRSVTMLLKEWQQHLQFLAQVTYQHQKRKYPTQTLSTFTKNERMVFT